MTARSERWLAEPVSPEVEAALARLCAADDVQQVAVMPDVHLASDVCVGVALATTRLVYPAAVGGDIGCGVAALGFDLEAGALRVATAARLFEALAAGGQVRLPLAPTFFSPGFGMVADRFGVPWIVAARGEAA